MKERKKVKKKKKMNKTIKLRRRKRKQHREKDFKDPKTKLLTSLFLPVIEKQVMEGRIELEGLTHFS